jgi:hypothetical protein
MVGWSWTEWMAGVPIYCKVSNCPLILEGANNQYKCNFKKSKVKDYKQVSELNEIDIEYIEKLL